jgi:hypothetical protein
MAANALWKYSILFCYQKHRTFQIIASSLRSKKTTRYSLTKSNTITLTRYKDIKPNINKLVTSDWLPINELFKLAY